MHEKGLGKAQMSGTKVGEFVLPCEPACGFSAFRQGNVLGLVRYSGSGTPIRAAP